MSALGRGLRRMVDAAAAADTVDLVTRLTLVILALADWSGTDDWRFRFPRRVLAVAGLVLPGLHRSRLLWGLIALVMAGKTLQYWWIQDNHIFLLTYWCLALALSFGLARPAPALAFNGRMLIGLSFALAVLWKGVLSPEYLNGTFFHYALLTDPRFPDVGILFGGMSETLYRQNYEALNELARYAGSQSVELRDTAGIASLATTMTWWTLAIEAAIAVAFLWPVGRGPSRYRHALLLVFAWSTYAVATVEAFGWSLLTLGLAQCEPEHSRTRLLYILTCLLVLAYAAVPLLSLARGG